MFCHRACGDGPTVRQYVDKVWKLLLAPGGDGPTGFALELWAEVCSLHPRG
jgi:hypothetical protein